MAAPLNVPFVGQTCVLFDDDDIQDVLEINVVKATIGQVNEVSLGRAVRVSPESILPVVSLSCSVTSPTSFTPPIITRYVCS